MRLVFGLGNPGDRFQKSRHNVGFLVVDALASKHNINVDSYKFQTFLGKGKIHDVEILLAKPFTFINLAGEAAKRICQQFHIQTPDLIAITDDADLDMGRIKIARKGGDAGHLGMRSVIKSLGSEDFPRVRIGIGRPPIGIQLREYVLQKFTEKEWETVESAIIRATSAIETMIGKGIEEAMTRYNRVN